MNQLATVPDTSLENVTEKVQGYINNSKAANTVKAYRSDWSDFTSWCGNYGFQVLPATPEVIASYIANMVENGYKAATIERRLVSISKAHVTAGLDDATKSPVVKETWAGIKRTINTAQTAKSPVLTSDIKAMVSTLPGTRIGTRDRALLLLGFAGGFRRSELVALNVEDLEFKREWLGSISETATFLTITQRLI